jgi:hypothetical protein
MKKNFNAKLGSDYVNLNFKNLDIVERIPIA